MKKRSVFSAPVKLTSSEDTNIEKTAVNNKIHGKGDIGLAKTTEKYDHSKDINLSLNPDKTTLQTDEENTKRRKVHLTSSQYEDIFSTVLIQNTEKCNSEDLKKEEPKNDIRKVKGVKLTSSQYEDIFSTVLLKSDEETKAEVRPVSVTSCQYEDTSTKVSNESRHQTQSSQHQSCQHPDDEDMFADVKPNCTGKSHGHMTVPVPKSSHLTSSQYEELFSNVLTDKASQSQSTGVGTPTIDSGSKIILSGTVGSSFDTQLTKLSFNDSPVKKRLPKIWNTKILKPAAKENIKKVTPKFSPKPSSSNGRKAKNKLNTSQENKSGNRKRATLTKESVQNKTKQLNKKESLSNGAIKVLDVNNQNSKPKKAGNRKKNVTGDDEKVCLMDDQQSYGTKKLKRLEKLRENRMVGLWVMCSYTSCSKWRYLNDVFDPLELPKDWFCWLNPDKEFNSCKVPERLPSEEEEKTLIENEYHCGSVVWGKVDGYPWWPAMVDDDPDLEQYFYLELESVLPTHYHVVFFDSAAVSRAWLPPQNIKAFTVFNLSASFKKTVFHGVDYSARLSVAREQATAAKMMTHRQRLETFSFLARYQGKIDKKKGIKRKMCSPRNTKTVDISVSMSDSDSSVDLTRFKKNRVKSYSSTKTNPPFNGENKKLNVTNIDRRDNKLGEKGSSKLMNTSLQPKSGLYGNQESSSSNDTRLMEVTNSEGDGSILGVRDGALVGGLEPDLDQRSNKVLAVTNSQETNSFQVDFAMAEQDVVVNTDNSKITQLNQTLGSEIPETQVKVKHDLTHSIGSEQCISREQKCLDTIKKEASNTTEETQNFTNNGVQQNTECSLITHIGLPFNAENKTRVVEEESLDGEVPNNDLRPVELSDEEIISIISGETEKVDKLKEIASEAVKYFDNLQHLTKENSFGKLNGIAHIKRENAFELEEAIVPGTKGLNSDEFDI